VKGYGYGTPGSGSRVPPSRRTAFITVLLGLTLAPFASAQERGVFVDPDSPAGKEYAIPLEQARGEAAGDSSGREGGGVANGSSAQPLFGVGIERPDGGARGQDAGAAETDRSGGANQRREGQDGGSGTSPGKVAPNARSTAAIEAAASGGSDALLTAGIAGAVLGAGLLAGFGLRRLLRDS
jgi:hypothetical protein